MQNNTAFKFAPVFTDEQKIDVALENGQAVIKLSTWVEDLGWCGQKTIALDTEILDELSRLVTAAKMKLKRDAEDDSDEILSARILDFPRSA